MAAAGATCREFAEPCMRMPCLIALLVLSPLAVGAPRTPIEHVVVIVGENRTFDNLFATYQPRRGQRVWNLLSQGIVRADGSPGPNFSRARQRVAEVREHYSPVPRITGEYDSLPPPYAADALGQRRDVPDARFDGPLPNGPYSITAHVGYGAHTGDPVHRFFQMRQQLDGGRNDLFVWTAVTVGKGPSNTPPPPISAGNTYQGGVAMGFYNMAAGDAPYFRNLADRYALADNYHQPILGGTTANYFALATGDVGFFTADGLPAVPPARLIEDPDPQPGTNNWYTEDGYTGGSFVACADRSAPGVGPIRDWLDALPYKAFRDGNCEPGHYYMVNNQEPAFLPDGSPRRKEKWNEVLPPQVIPTIGGALSQAGVGWKWYSGGRNDGHEADKEYCATCDPHISFSAVMQGTDQARLQDLQQFYLDVRDEKNFPAVSFIAPYDSVSGHPGYAMEPAFDELVSGILQRLQSNPKLWQHTALVITFDEGGGYYDSGYVQAIDFFGDGTRIPMLVVSPWARAGHVDHTYYDHASILKFIEYNWGVPPLSGRSRDNLPNPVHDAAEPYVPRNRPAIGDLTGMFDFGRRSPAPGR